MGQLAVKPRGFATNQDQKRGLGLAKGLRRRGGRGTSSCLGGTGQPQRQSLLAAVTNYKFAQFAKHFSHMANKQLQLAKI